jgi:DNA helicase-2/ATP-dependent DNA helicase PcrA
MPESFDLVDDDEPTPGRSGAPAREPAYLQGLNPEQREAVEVLDGPVLVLAGAGTGKTRVLTTRIAHLLATRRAFPGQILAVTFTNKAAREMQERVGALVGAAVEGMPWLGTFHAIAARILRRHAELVGLKPSFTILDTDDQLRLLKQVLAAEDVDDKRWPARVIAGQIDRWKNRGLIPEKVPGGEAEAVANGRGRQIYASYQERLATLNATDFGDLLLLNTAIFQAHPEVLAEYHNRFRYILVDEYQDTNVAQYLWLRLLAQGRRNVCCVGDDDQSIYGWRGAEVGNILKFEHDFPGAKVIRLERNYRSTSHILAAASGLIAANQGRLGKTLWTEAEGGEPVKVAGYWDGEEEARAIAEEIEALQRGGERLSDVAILVRAGFQTRAFEERFITLGVPYKVIGGPRFYERQEIRDALAYLRVVSSPDDDLAFERIVNVPKRGLGDATLQVLHGIARLERISLTRAARAATETDELKPKARATLRDLLDNIDRWGRLADELPHTELAEMVLDESGYTTMWQNDKSPEAPGRLDNLKELIQAMGYFENLTGFLEHVSLVMENEEANPGDQVTLMTLHGAKGLEFRNVFLPGWEEGVFPSQRTLDENGLAGLEEERRLAYVGLTRARVRAYVSHVANRRIYNQWQSCIPSRFVDELPAEHVEQQREVSFFAQPAREAGSTFDRDDFASETFGAPRGGPGWRRAQEAFRADPGGLKSRASARLIDAVPEIIATDDPSRSRFSVGERVFHQKFGYGRIRHIEGNKLEVAFEHSGPKKVIDSFVTRA